MGLDFLIIRETDSLDIQIEKLENLLKYFNKIYIPHLSAVIDIRKGIKDKDLHIEESRLLLKEQFNLEKEFFKSLPSHENGILENLYGICSQYFQSNKFRLGRMMNFPSNDIDVFELEDNLNIGQVEAYYAKFQLNLEESHKRIYQKISSSMTKLVERNKSFCNKK